MLIPSCCKQVDGLRGPDVVRHKSAPGRSEVFDHTWISHNPDPPNFDPQVVADPGYPLFHHPRSTLPLDCVRLALEEFCRASSGERPQCIQWVQGELNGQRLGEETAVDFVDTSDVTDPWA
jgi:hypothetical protein